MKQSTITQLNQLNLEFYATVAEDFDDSRQYYWPGWEQLIPFIEESSHNQKLRILDLGCGNGRFGLFLAERFSDYDIVYKGADSSTELLVKAQTALSTTSVKSEFKPQDIVDMALNKQLSTCFDGHQFDLIVLFGVMHHIPSYKLRLSFLNQLKSTLRSGGHIVFSAWQFADFDRFTKKQINPAQVGVDPLELETNDFLLDWQRGPHAIRYCHHFDQKELDHLQKDVQLSRVCEFSADGKEGNINRYQVYQVT